MAYIPKEHEQYDPLPACRQRGGEVFLYPSDLLWDLEARCPGENLMPYGYQSYDEYYAFLREVAKHHADHPNTIAILNDYRAEIERMNRKEEWSIVRYIGETTDALLELTHGRCYYWPCAKDTPYYEGVIDNEEFTSYLYSTDPLEWEIVLDPTGMAARAIAAPDGLGGTTQSR